MGSAAGRMTGGLLSRLDGISCWGYCVRGSLTNPHTDAAAFAVAFPARFYKADGSLDHREMLPGKDIYDSLESDLAKPLGMQDFNRTIQK